MRFKFAVFTLSLLMILTMTSSAFAQGFGLFNVYPTSEARGRLHGYGEEAGSVTFLWQAPSVLVSTSASDTITITYGARIDNDIAVDGATPGTDIAIRVCSNDFVDRIDTATVSTPTSPTTQPLKAMVNGDKITVRLAGSTCNTDAAVIDVSGVRLALAGEGQDDITANVRGGGAVRLVGATEFLVIRSIVDELTDAGVKVKPAVTLIRHTGAPKSDGKFKLMLTEKRRGLL